MGRQRSDKKGVRKMNETKLEKKVRGLRNALNNGQYYCGKIDGILVSQGKSRICDNIRFELQNLQHILNNKMLK